MPASALKRVAAGQNGLGAFILQCTKMDFHYCDWGGSSRGMKGFIKSHLCDFAKANPEIEITVSPRPGKHPVVVGYYVNGRQKPICVRKLEALQVLKKAELLRDASGERLVKPNKPVRSINESVRGIWSPYHGDALSV